MGPLIYAEWRDLDQKARLHTYFSVYFKVLLQSFGSPIAPSRYQMFRGHAISEGKN